MTDPERELLKWVAEELLGWVFPGETDSVTRMKAERFAFEKLQSWGGIGLVVEEMEKRGWIGFILERTFPYLSDERYYLSSFFGHEKPFVRERGTKPWFAVFGAARKAMTHD